jgi:hypothetical protein
MNESHPGNVKEHDEMDVKTLLRQQMRAMHGTLEAAIGDCGSDSLSHKAPGSTINCIGAIYAHTVMGEDGLVNGLVRGTTPVYFERGWAPKIGIEMPQGSMEPDWNVTLDLNLFRQYAADVYAATDDYLANAADDELAKIVDAGFAPPMPAASFFADILSWHVATHQGEISALKGVQGINGLVLTH